MLINQIIAMFFPSFIALGVFNYLKRGQLKIRDLVIYYFIFVTIINLVTYSASLYIFNDGVVFDTGYTIKYLFLSSVIAAVAPAIADLLNKTVSIKIKKRKS